jgi:hypothetical protein
VQAAPVAAEAAAATAAAAAAAPPPSRWCKGTGIFVIPGRLDDDDKDDSELLPSLDVVVVVVDEDELDAISTALTLSTFKYIKRIDSISIKDNRANPSTTESNNFFAF